MVFVWWVALLKALKAAGAAAGGAAKTVGASVAQKGVVQGVTSAAGKAIGGKTGALVTQAGKTIDAMQGLAGGGDAGSVSGGTAAPGLSSQVRNDPLRSEVGMGTRMDLETPKLRFEPLAEPLGEIDPYAEDQRRRRLARRLRGF